MCCNQPCNALIITFINVIISFEDKKVTNSDYFSSKKTIFTKTVKKEIT